MYEKLLSMYKRNLINEHELDNAILKGWITKEEKELIINEYLI